jgi:hypothetical protein
MSSYYNIYMSSYYYIYAHRCWWRLTAAARAPSGTKHSALSRSATPIYMLSYYYIYIYIYIYMLIVV